MKFEYEYTSSIGIEYGFIKGSSTLLFIKAGLDGSLCGYEDKYVQIAHRIHEVYNDSILCSSNPSLHIDPFEDAMEVLHQLHEKEQIDFERIEYMGFSNGGMMGAWSGYKYPIIKKMLLVNPPLMFSWHKTKEGIQQFQGESATFVLSDQDPSIAYAELLQPLLNEKIKLEIIENEDHCFTKDMEDFLSLPQKYLKNS